MAELKKGVKFKMDDILNAPLNEFEFEDELEHHGVKGQKWGVRNAEWYPIDAYLRSKGLDQKASSAVSTASDVAKKVKAKASAAGEVIKEKTSKAKEAYSEHKAKQKKKNAVKKAQRTREQKKIEERKEEAFEEKKQRILNEGTPGEVLAIADKCTNQELRYALERNNTLSELRKAENTRVKQVNEKKVRKKWGKYIDMAESLEMSTKPVADVTKVIERFQKLNKALSGKTDDKDKDKKKKKKSSDDSNKAED